MRALLIAAICSHKLTLQILLEDKNNEHLQLLFVSIYLQKFKFNYNQIYNIYKLQANIKASSNSANRFVRARFIFYENNRTKQIILS